MQIRHATTPHEIAAIKSLFQEYASSLRVDLCFQGFADELRNLPGEYASPHGRLLLASWENESTGCVALRPASDGACELKRLFVHPAHQGRGLGKRLAQQAISEAKCIGYSRIILDTLPFMHGAIHLYESLGFIRRPAYYDTPLQETIFMELQI